MADFSDTTVALATPPRPRKLNDRYVVYGRIGAGGMADVFKGYDTVLKREVAIKILQSQYASDASFTQRFKTEAQAAAQLRSPHTVSIYDAGEDGSQYFIVMELVHGFTMKKILGDVSTIPTDTIATIARQICSALKEAHDIGIIHRDIKSSNIMVTYGESEVPEARVMDFGIAKAKHLGDESNDEGLIIGTLPYMSPEQANGSSAITPATDLYSLGVIMYEACAGRLPFLGGSKQVISKINSEAPIPPQHLNPAVDDDFNDIVLKALSKNPADRFANASEMRAVLESYLASDTHPHRELDYPLYWALGFIEGPDDILNGIQIIDRPSVLGRSADCDIVVHEQSVSREHLKLTPRGLYLEVEDLVSSNGTYICNEPISSPTLCKAGTILDIGTVKIRIGKKRA